MALACPVIPPPRPGHCGRSILGQPIFPLLLGQVELKGRLFVPYIFPDIAIVREAFRELVKLAVADDGLVAHRGQSESAS